MVQTFNTTGDMYYAASVSHDRLNELSYDRGVNMLFSLRDKGSFQCFLTIGLNRRPNSIPHEHQREPKHYIELEAIVVPNRQYILSQHEAKNIHQTKSM